MAEEATPETPAPIERASDADIVSAMNEASQVDAPDPPGGSESAASSPGSVVVDNEPGSSAPLTPPVHTVRDNEPSSGGTAPLPSSIPLSQVADTAKGGADVATTDVVPGAPGPPADGGSSGEGSSGDAAEVPGYLASPAPEGFQIREIGGKTYHIADAQVGAFDAQQQLIRTAQSAQSAADSRAAMAQSQAALVQRQLEDFESRLAVPGASGGDLAGGGMPASSGGMAGDPGQVPDFSQSAEALDTSLGANGEVKKFAAGIGEQVNATLAAAMGPMQEQMETLAEQNEALQAHAAAQIEANAGGVREAAIQDYFGARGRPVDDDARRVFAEKEAQATRILSERAAASGQTITIADIQRFYPTIAQSANEQIVMAENARLRGQGSQAIPKPTTDGGSDLGVPDQNVGLESPSVLTPSGLAGHAGGAPKDVQSARRAPVAAAPDGSLESMLSHPDQVRYTELE